MRNYRNIIPLIILLLAVGTGCSNNKKQPTNRIVIGIAMDVETINPLYAFGVNEGDISELLFLKLVSQKWDNNQGTIESYPMLAKSWSWNREEPSITVQLRDDVKWSDGLPCNAEDVVFSFDVYSDPQVESKAYGMFENYAKDSLEHIDIANSFEIISPYVLKINFKSGSNPSFFDIDYPIIPKHIFDKIERKDFFTAEANFNPVSNGPYKLDRWEKNQIISLKLNRESFLADENSISEIIYKVIPEYNSRLIQFEKGDLDLIKNLKPEDGDRIQTNPKFKVVSVKGREYDYIGWNNISPAEYQNEKEIVPHKLFGTSNVRKALTYAVNRNIILEEFLYSYGELCNGPVSPIFKNAIDPQVTSYEYDINKAIELLSKEGWTDSDRDGILEKGDEEFKFKLYIPAGNPRRNYAATLIKNDLKKIGVEVAVETVEMGVLIDKLFEKSLDAWMVGWIIPIPLEFKSYWHSDLETASLNFSSYQSAVADKYINSLDQTNNEDEKNSIYKNIQKIIYDDQPVSFLYWIESLTAHNNKIKNIDINPLGIVHHCWEWRVEQ